MRARMIGRMQAAADFLGPGAIETNKYQSEIFDLVKRRGVFLGERIQQTPATGQPSRYFEQTAIPTAGTTDPRAITATASQPERQEMVVSLKCMVAQVNFGIFDVEVNQQQGTVCLSGSQGSHRRCRWCPQTSRSTTLDR